MQTGVVNRDDGVWQGHPDVAFFRPEGEYGSLFVVYRESDQHKTACETRIKLARTAVVDYNTRTSFFEMFFDPITIATSTDRYNCPRLSVIGDALYIICDRVRASEDYVGAEDTPDLTSVLMWRSTNGDFWEGPIELGITGIVPDRIFQFHNKFLIATHIKESMQKNEENEENKEEETEVDKKNFLPYNYQGNLVQNVWISNDLEGPWLQHSVAKKEGLNLCEGSIFYVKPRLFCIMRENSARGRPAYVCTSKDGTDWSTVMGTRMAGCHRPVCGRLRSGQILTTYREASHSFSRGYWAKNTFACLTHPSSLLQSFNKSIILPLDHDHSKRSDSGYTGWVQLPDDSIFVVNYITGDAPKPYIKWYRFDESEF